MTYTTQLNINNIDIFECGNLFI